MENVIDFLQFRQLLQSLENSNTAIRLRMMGEQWMDFSSVVILSEHAMLLQANGQRKLITNLRNVVEIEIDNAVGDLAANRVYSIAC
jgi:hypothetical protein